MNLAEKYKRIALCLFCMLTLLLCQQVSFALEPNYDNLDLDPNKEVPKLYSEMPSDADSKATSEAKFIKNIEITGTNVIKPDYVLNLMDIQAGDEYNKGVVQQNLKNIYETGFFTDRIKAIPIENKDKTITLKIILEENIPVTDFTLEGNTVVSTEEILPFLLPLKGKPQNYAQINDAIQNIQNYYAEKGYILARVSSLTDDPDGVLNLVFAEGEINKILISGNSKTKNYVIERNILSEPGMIYNENLIKADLIRLYATQAFKDVNREIEPSEEDYDKYDVTITVEEQRTAQISVGGGLDSGTGIFGSVGISDNNFRGLNQRVGLNFMLGSGMILNDNSVLKHMNTQAELSFFEPYFFNADTSLMGKVFFRDFGSYQVPLAIEQRFGIQGTVAHALKSNKHLTATFTTGIENIKVKEGDAAKMRSLFYSSGIPISYRAQQLNGGLFLTLAPGLTFDTRDSSVNPRSGMLANVKFEQAIGLDSLIKSHGRLNGMIKQYVPVASKSSVSFTAKGGGILYGAEGEIPEVMAYRLGGPYTVRGFQMSGVGTGGAFAMGSVELSTPFFFLDRIKKVKFFDNLKFTAFVDAGKIFDTTPTNLIYDRPLQAVSAGVGIKLYIPGVGPLAVDYGIPLTNPGSQNQKGYFTFGVGDMMY